MSTARKLYGPWTFEAVQALEGKTGERFEFVDGIAIPRDLVVFGMAGASPAHDDLVVELLGQMHAQLHRGPDAGRCRVQTADTKVGIRALETKEYRYPDLAIVCGERDYLEGTNILVNPAVVFEVVSPSSEGVDGRDKLEEYTSIASLEAYVVVMQDRKEVTIHRRVAGSWSRSIVYDGIHHLPGIAASLDVDLLFGSLGL